MVGPCQSWTIKWLALLLRHDPATPTCHLRPPLQTERKKKTGIAPKLSFFCSYMCYMEFFLNLYIMYNVYRSATSKCIVFNPFLSECLMSV